MNSITRTLNHNPLSLKDYRRSLIRVLHSEALESGVFTESNVLLGAGDFYDCFPTKEEADQHYREFIDSFYAATGKKFLGGTFDDREPATSDDYAPDPSLPEEEYRDALEKVFFDAHAGAEAASRWDLFVTERDYELRLTYAEFLALSAGLNAWRHWLDTVVDLDDVEMEPEVYNFIEEADDFYLNDFWGFVENLRAMREENAEKA